MTSHRRLEVMSSSLLPSPTGSSGSGHTCRLSCQMRNPLGKLRALQPSSALVLGDDVLVEDPKAHNISLEPPIVCSLDHVKEGSVSSSWPLKGFVDPMG